MSRSTSAIVGYKATDHGAGKKRYARIFESAGARVADSSSRILCKCTYDSNDWRGRGSVISVPSWIGHRTTSRFQWEERVVHECALRSCIAKMHNACLRNCQRYEHPRAASLHLFALRRTQSRFLCVHARARMNRTSDGRMINRNVFDLIRISKRRTGTTERVLSPGVYANGHFPLIAKSGCSLTSSCAITYTKLCTRIPIVLVTSSRKLKTP